MHTADRDFTNRSSVNRGDANKGSRGLFTEEQLADRLRVHAKSIAVKYPTVGQIVTLWKEKYNIDITDYSERQWRRSNWKLIEKTKQQMIESGEIQSSVVGPKALSDSLCNLSIDTTKSMIEMRKKLHSVITKIDPEANDPDKIKQNRENTRLFSALADSLTKLSNSLTKQLSTLVDLSGNARARQAEDDDDDEAEREARAVDKDFDPSEHQITDADRLTQ